MAFVLFDTGATQIANSYFKKVEPTAGNSLTLKLFVNDITPTNSHTVLDFIEASGGGYSPLTIAPEDITVSSVGDIVQAAFPPHVFEFTGALDSTATVYGVLLVDADGVGIGAERAAEGYTPSITNTEYNTVGAIKISEGTAS